MKQTPVVGLIILFSLLTSCSFAPVDPVPTDKYYRLPDPSPSIKKQVFDGDVYVRNFRSKGLYLGRAMLYSEDEQGLVLKQHHYHYWQDAPPRMLQAQLVSWLRSANAAPLVMTDPSIAHQYVISARIDRLERHLKKKSASVIVALEMQLQRRGTDKLLLANDYVEEIEIESRTVKSSIPVYAKALDSIFTRFLEDAEKVLAQDDK
jgi:ABC-type uncharacterized transport system auxiliary subunit